MVYQFQGDKVEGEKTKVITRKFVRSAPQHHPKLGRCLKFSCSLNASVEILKTLDLKPEELVSKDSNLNVEDKLYSENLYFLVKGVKRLKFIKIKESGRHNAQKSQTQDHTFAEITKPFNHITKAIEARQQKAIEGKKST